MQNGQISNLIERSQYNIETEKLFYFAKKSQHSYSKFTEFKNYFIVDSMPLGICKVARHNRIKIYKDDSQNALDKSFYTSQNAWFYSYRFHRFFSINKYYKSKCSRYTFIKGFKNTNHWLYFLMVIFLSSTLELDLFETANIKLKTPMKIKKKE